MPVRVNVITRLVEKMNGGPWVWNGLTGLIEDDRMSQERYDALIAEADGWYAQIVDQIDWNRVLFEAATRCLRLNHEHDETTAMLFGEEGVCGESLREAALTKDSIPEWFR